MNTILAISDSEALEAVRSRDRRYDGKFVFAVVTTGVFCRPSCKSRQANPENIRFYESTAQAKQAGFRACKRCSPEQRFADNEKMIAVARYIESHADETLTLAKLASMFKLSPTHLQKSFKSTIGMSPKTYGSSSRVYEQASGKLGMTPGAYKSGAAGEQISYTCGLTKFGCLMLAATDKGVCFVMFGDEENELRQKLKEEFPGAITERSVDDDQIKQWYAQINQFLSAGIPMPNIPLDIRGTAFQMRVWAFLQSISEGDVVSYRDVAVGIGQPAAIRAAATACAKNRIALLVPCHRVLRGDGGIGGYRWGVDTKRFLLSLEAQRSTETDR